MGIDPCKLVLNPEMHGQGKTGLHQDAGGGHGVQAFTHGFPNTGGF